MTGAKRGLDTFGRRAAWVESERFPAAIIRDKCGALSEQVIDEIRPAWQEYRANERLHATIGTRQEQIAAARELAALCRDAGKALMKTQIDHLEADAWHAASLAGFDLEAEKQEIGRRLRVIAGAYLAAAERGAAPVRTKPPKTARNDLVLAVYRAVRPSVERETEAADIVASVIAEAGIVMKPATLERVIRAGK